MPCRLVKKFIEDLKESSRLHSRAEFPEDLHNKFEIVQFSFCPLQLGGGLIFPTTVGRRRIELFRIYCASLLGAGL